MHRGRYRRLGLGLGLAAGLAAVLLSFPDPDVPRIDQAADQVIRTPVAPAPLVATRAAPRESDLPTRRHGLQPAQRTVVRLYCCPTVERIFGRELEQAFESAHQGVDLRIVARGDRECVGHLLMGNGDAAIIGTTLSANEQGRGLRDWTLAHYLVVPVVHRSNPLESLSRTDLQALVRGAVQNWRRVGGADVPVKTVGTDDGPDDQASRISRMGGAEGPATVLGDPRQVLAFVASDVGAFGLLSAVQARGARDVRILRIGGVEPSPTSLTRGDWPLGTSIRFVAPPQSGPEVQALLALLQSEQGSRLLRLGFELPARR